MRSISILTVVAALATVACASESSTLGRIGNPVTPSGSSTTAITGAWVGQASDSSGTMMGAGMSTAMMANMTWQITQTGDSFTGTMQFPGYAGPGPMTIAGTISGHTATFTMTMPRGGMMTATCSAVANGIFDIDDLFTQMHGSYAGTNMCGGPFDHGQLSMTRR
jgi:hypothetical protein